MPSVPAGQAVPLLEGNEGIEKGNATVSADRKRADESAANLQPNPEIKSNLFTYVSFLFMAKFLRKGYTKTLEEEDMFEPLPQHDARRATARMNKAWEHEMRLAEAAGRKPALLTAIRREYWCDIAKYGVCLALEEISQAIKPLLMGRLIRFFSNIDGGDLTVEDAYIAAAGVAFTSAFSTIIHHPYFYGIQKIGMELKIAASGMVVNKGIRLSSAALHKTTVGNMVNLLSTDVNKFDGGFLFIHFMWLSPLLLVIYTTFLVSTIGVSAIAGFIAILVLFPIQGYFSKQMGNCRREIAKRSDKRISVMNEILNGIRVIKMYAWEGAFSQIVADLRSYELQMVKRNAIFQSLVMGLFWSSGKIVVLFAALCFVLLGNELNAEKIFVSAALYNSCRLPITLFLPFSIQFFFELKASMGRIQNFLELEDFSRAPQIKSNDETKTQTSKKNGKGEKEPLTQSGNEIPLVVGGGGESIVNSVHDADAQIELSDFSSTWQTEEDEGEQEFAVRNLSFKANRGQLVAVVGPVGAGKSSLLSSLLGEARRVFGRLYMSGTVAYCSQDSWIFSGTIRENVIFGNDFDQVKYDKALEVSALLSDVSQFPHGDATLVGDRGTSLSGGQKARVALARAVYADSDIYLLDDPLSAVDAAVGRFLFDKCIRDHLRNKVVILVTHQVQFLDKADVVLLMKNGEIIASGTPCELKVSHAEQFAALLQETEQSYARQISESASGTTPRHTARSMSVRSADLESLSEAKSFEHINELLRSPSEESAVDAGQEKAEHVPQVVEEERADGSVSMRIYGEYVKAMCLNALTIPPLFLVVIGVQLLFNGVDWWLNKWTNAAERHTAAVRNGTEYIPDRYDFFGFFAVDVDLDLYMWIFTLLTVLLVVLAVVRCIWFRLAQVVAVRVLHERMFNAIVNTKIAFFDQNPIGRILNRFSKDVGTMDDQLSFTFFEFLMGALSFTGSVAMIVYLNVSVFLFTLPLMVIFAVLRLIYLHSSRDVKRLEATTRSPLYSHISAVMQGLITVRAFNRQDEVISQYYRAQNINSAAFYLTLTTSRWFAIWIDYLVVFFVIGVAFAAIIFRENMNSSEVALMLVYAVQLTGFFSWIMRQSAELQNGMVSVERIVHYAELESEHDDSDAKEPDSWPTQGHLKMDHVHLKYNEEEYVLKDICLDIKPKEKIGIVGRTGAGKSSLLRALFRLTVPCEGNVYIDGVNTKDVPLKRLRKNIAIIPQEPVLFIGTVRRNLDPFNEFDDAALWDALEQVELKSVIQEMADKLEAPMQEGGTNFSVGQRQLVCLARALLRHAKILVIDEATANVDQQTDALIQKTIRARFADSTVLTIAHRLNTIMDSTRVLVLKDGEVAEFASAHELLQQRNSIFSSLVEETGKANANLLRQLARETYNKHSQFEDVAEN